jgi:hypothetical protein
MFPALRAIDPVLRAGFPAFRALKSNVSVPSGRRQDKKCFLPFGLQILLFGLDFLIFGPEI